MPWSGSSPSLAGTSPVKALAWLSSEIPSPDGEKKGHARREKEHLTRVALGDGARGVLGVAPSSVTRRLPRAENPGAISSSRRVRSCQPGVSLLPKLRGTAMSSTASHRQGCGMLLFRLCAEKPPTNLRASLHAEHLRAVSSLAGPGARGVACVARVSPRKEGEMCKDGGRGGAVSYG